MTPFCAPDLLAGGACCLLENRPRPDADVSNPMGDYLGRLTLAERRVLAHLRAGLSNKEIAAAVGRSPTTVKHQVGACLQKLGQPSRARLIAALR